MFSPDGKQIMKKKRKIKPHKGKGKRAKEVKEEEEEGFEEEEEEGEEYEEKEKLVKSYKTDKVYNKEIERLRASQEALSKEMKEAFALMKTLVDAQPLEGGHQRSPTSPSATSTRSSITTYYYILYYILYFYLNYFLLIIY